MKTTLLLLSLVAIALISGTEANTRYCSNCRGNHKRAGSFKGMWGMKDEMDDLYDDMGDEEDEAVGSYTQYYPPNHRYHVRRRQFARRKAECLSRDQTIWVWANYDCRDRATWILPDEIEADKPRRLRRSYCSNCRGNHKRAGSFKGMWGMKDEMDDLYDDMGDEEDEAVGSYTQYYPPNHRYHVRRRQFARRKAECLSRDQTIWVWANYDCRDRATWILPDEIEADKPRRLRRSYCSNCRGNHKRAGSFKGMWGMKDEMDDLYDDMGDEEDEAVGSYTRYYPPNHKYHVRRREFARRKAECLSRDQTIWWWVNYGCRDRATWIYDEEDEAVGSYTQEFATDEIEADKPRRLRQGGQGGYLTPEMRWCNSYRPTTPAIHLIIFKC
eukprot:g12965.t1